MSMNLLTSISALGNSWYLGWWTLGSSVGKMLYKAEVGVHFGGKHDDCPEHHITKSEPHWEHSFYICDLKTPALSPSSHGGITLQPCSGHHDLPV